MTLIDTAEMYGNGGAEEVVAEAIAGPARQAVHRQQGVSAERLAQRRAGGVRAQPEAAAHRSDRPLSAALARQPSAGRDGGGVRGAAGGRARSATGACRTSTRATCRSWCGCRAARTAPPTRCCTMSAAAASSSTCCRGAREHKIPLMAYSPVGQGGRLLQSKALAAVAKRHNATPAQIAIAWSMRHANVITIPKASDPAARARERRGRRDRADRRGPGGDRRRASAAGTQAVARHFVVS